MIKPTRKQLATAITDLLEQNAAVETIAREVAAYLLAERRTRELAPLMRDITYQRAARGIVEATATSAFSLEPSIKKTIEQLVSEPYKEVKQVILHQEHNPELVGGVRITASGQHLDLSIHGRLKRLSSALINPAKGDI